MSDSWDNFWAFHCGPKLGLFLIHKEFRTAVVLVGRFEVFMVVRFQV